MTKAKKHEKKFFSVQFLRKLVYSAHPNDMPALGETAATTRGNLTITTRVIRTSQYNVDVDVRAVGLNGGVISATIYDLRKKAYAWGSAANAAAAAQIDDFCRALTPKPRAYHVTLEDAQIERLLKAQAAEIANGFFSTRMDDFVWYLAQIRFCAGGWRCPTPNAYPDLEHQAVRGGCGNALKPVILRLQSVHVAHIDEYIGEYPTRLDGSHYTHRIRVAQFLHDTILQAIEPKSVQTSTQN